MKQALKLFMSHIHDGYHLGADLEKAQMCLDGKETPNDLVRLRLNSWPAINLSSCESRGQ